MQKVSQGEAGLGYWGSDGHLTGHVRKERRDWDRCPDEGASTQVPARAALRQVASLAYPNNSCALGLIPHVWVPTALKEANNP